MLFLTTLISCSSSLNEKHQPQSSNSDNRKIDTLLELELADSFKLTHIYRQFYKGASGHIYERTFADREINGIDSLVSVEYFNGLLPQDIDPLTFQELDGWFAKDKNFAYYYRPTSGGMLIEKLDSADAKTFKVLQGHYKYAIDKNYVFEESSTIKDLNPKTLKILRDNKGKIVKLRSGNKVFVASVD
jgi:hypothetical protein